MVFLTITLPAFRTRTQLPLGLGMLNSPVAYRTICANTLRCINQIIMKIVCGPTYVALAYYFILFRYSYRLHPYTLVRINSPRASSCSILRQQSQNTFYSIVQHPEFSIICIGSEPCPWSIVGLPGSCAYYVMFCYIG